MATNLTLEKTKKRNKLWKAILLISIPALIAGFFSLFSTQSPATKNNSIDIKENIKSPIANEIETQNNYYVNSPESKDTTPQKWVQAKSSGKEQAHTEKKESQRTQNALIITNDQKGGSNTVNVNQIPPPEFKLVEIEEPNKVVKEMRSEKLKKKINLPNAEYQHDSLFKTEFTINFYSAANLAKIGFWIKRNDVVKYEVNSNGLVRPSEITYKDTKQPLYVLTAPQLGNYYFKIYTVNKFGNPLEEVEVIK